MEWNTSANFIDANLNLWLLHLEIVIAFRRKKSSASVTRATFSNETISTGEFTSAIYLVFIIWSPFLSLPAVFHGNPFKFQSSVPAELFDFNYNFVVGIMPVTVSTTTMGVYCAVHKIFSKCCVANKCWTFSIFLIDFFPHFWEFPIFFFYNFLHFFYVFVCLGIWVFGCLGVCVWLPFIGSCIFVIK